MAQSEWGSVATVPGPDTGHQPTDIPVLVELAGQTQGARHTLDRPEIELGRSLDADIQLTAEDTSRQHATIVQQPDGRVLIIDRGSRNGTFVNDQPVKTRQLLQAGDRIRFGAQALFLFTRQSPVEERFLEAQKLECVGRLTRSIAHDFNNLLASLQAEATYLQQELSKLPDLPEDTLDCLKNIRHATTRSVELTTQLLRFAHHGSTDNQLFNLAELIDEVTTFLRIVLHHNVTIAADVEPQLLVLGDRVQIRQLVLNLALNGAEAMKQGGELAISARRRNLTPGEAATFAPLNAGPCIELVVRDGGRGMDDITRQRIFDPFFSNKEASQGSGLGLAAVHGIVRRHGGHLQVESSVGQGTMVTVRLAAPQPKSQPTLRNTTQDVRALAAVLVAIGDDSLYFSVAAELEKMAYRVSRVSGGREAISAALQADRMLELAVVSKDLAEGITSSLQQVAPELPVIQLQHNRPIQPQTFRAQVKTALSRRPTGD